MRNSVLLLLLLATCALSHGVAGYKEEGKRSRGGERSWGEGGGEEQEPSRYGSKGFLLQESKHVVRTEAGQMTVMRMTAERISDRPLHIGFITMEPKTLFVPQYSDSSLLLFLRRGEARVGRIYKDDLVERKLRIGDIYRIPAGSAFYILNTQEGQRLHIICSIDTSESLGIGTFQSFFIAGGGHPASVLAGFDMETLTTAFNVTSSELRDLFTSQQEGPILYTTESRAPSIWAKFSRLKEEDRLQHVKRVMEFQQQPFEEAKQTVERPWKKLLKLVLGKEETNKGFRKTPEAYNLYKRKPDFKNDYGWSIAVDGSDYSPLKHSCMGVYLVNLTAGSMLAPHVNPRATEYGTVLSGRGRVQVVFPNGTLAMDANVIEGDVFWVPRYFAFCQIASRSGPFEFFGFTTSAHRNRPQFLAGANSLLHALRGPELATAFGVSEERIGGILDAQREAVIIPSPSVAPPDEAERLFVR